MKNIRPHKIDTGALWLLHYEITGMASLYVEGEGEFELVLVYILLFKVHMTGKLSARRGGLPLILPTLETCQSVLIKRGGLNECT